MAKKTFDELLDRAEQAINNREEIVYDVASESGQIVGNVAHMRWFRNAVAVGLNILGELSR